MDIAIGKIFFLISAAWAVIVLFRIVSSLRHPRIKDPSLQHHIQPNSPEEPKRAHPN